MSVFAGLHFSFLSVSEFIEHLLCTRLCSRPGNTAVEKAVKLLPSWSAHKPGESLSLQVWQRVIKAEGGPEVEKGLCSVCVCVRGEALTR